jgi:hypothetical protein
MKREEGWKPYPVDWRDNWSRDYVVSVIFGKPRMPLDPPPPQRLWTCLWRTNFNKMFYAVPQLHHSP